MDKRTTDIVAYITPIGLIIALLLGQREDSKFHVNQALVIWIASLLGVTAYAAGWLGLSNRVQPAPPLMSAMPDPSDPAATPFEREPGGFISSNGYANSPAALAHKEWHEFWFRYTDSHPEMFEGEDWLPEDEAIKPYAVLYAAFDQAMLDKLAIAIKQFAKRQMTWFRRNPESVWLDMSGDAFDQACTAIDAFLRDE